jgi:hypothetical protein
MVLNLDSGTISTLAKGSFGEGLIPYKTYLSEMVWVRSQEEQGRKSL